MALVEALKSAQFVVDSNAAQKAVLLDSKAWEKLIDWIETIIDSKLAIQALAELETADGQPEKVGWLAWDDVREAWDGEEESEITTHAL